MSHGDDLVRNDDVLHPDDGRLHAYLDGELDAVDGDGAADTLERHLAGCAVCAARLEDARRTRAQADAILGVDAGVPAPPFAALEDRAAGRRAGSARRRFPTRVTGGLAWAASVAIAIGVGWYARALVLPGSADLAFEAPAAADPREARELRELAAHTERAVAEQQIVARDHAGADGEPAPAGRTARPAALAEADAPAGARAEAVPPTETAPRDTVAADSAVRGIPRDDRLAAREAPPEPVERAEPARVAADEGARRAGREPVAEPTAAEASRRRHEAILADVGPQRARAAEAPGPTPKTLPMAAPALPPIAPADWAPAGRREAERRYGGPLAFVRDLPVVGIALAETGGRVVARTTQPLDGGGFLELEQRPADLHAADAEADAGLVELDSGMAAGSTMIMGRLGNDIIVSRAPVSPDSLRGLLQRLTVERTP